MPASLDMHLQLTCILQCDFCNEWHVVLQPHPERCTAHAPMHPCTRALPMHAPLAARPLLTPGHRAHALPLPPSGRRAEVGVRGDAGGRD